MDKQVTKITIIGISGYCSAADAYKDRLTITRNKITYHYRPEIMKSSYNDSDDDLRTVENPEIKWTANYGSRCLKNSFEEIAELVLLKLEEGEPSPCCDIGVTEIIVEFADKSKSRKQFFQPADYFYDLFKCIQTLFVSEAFKMPVVIRTSDFYEE